MAESPCRDRVRRPTRRWTFGHGSARSRDTGLPRHERRPARRLASTRPLFAILAAIVLLVAGLAQATTFDRYPSSAAAIGAEFADEVDCDALRLRYTQEHSVWKAGVKAGMDENVEPNLLVMRAILRRLNELPGCSG
jgi:hypothetical protein